MMPNFMAGPILPLSLIHGCPLGNLDKTRKMANRSFCIISVSSMKHRVGHIYVAVLVKNIPLHYRLFRSWNVGSWKRARAPKRHCQHSRGDVIANAQPHAVVQCQLNQVYWKTEHTVITYGTALSSKNYSVTIVVQNVRVPSVPKVPLSQN